jgi:hypothetical protein
MQLPPFFCYFALFDPNSLLFTLENNKRIKSIKTAAQSEKFSLSIAMISQLSVLSTQHHAFFSHSVFENKSV